jgi:RNA polymerase sigma-70 factor (subfamily 1)
MDTGPSDIARIAAARSGDRQAFEALVRGHEKELEAFIRHHSGKRLGSKVEVDDLVQDTLLRAFRSIGQFEGDDARAFSSWLRSIAEHAILDSVRKIRAGKGLIEREVSIDQRRGAGESWEMELAQAASGGSPLDSLRREERFDRLKRVLSTLKPDHARVIVLARVQGLPIGEVARRMDRTPEATSMLLLRALVKLKSAFGETESFSLPERSLEGEGGEDGA